VSKEPKNSLEIFHSMMVEDGINKTLSEQALDCANYLIDNPPKWDKKVVYIFFMLGAFYRLCKEAEE